MTVRAPSLDVARVLEGARLVVVGGTGFLGKVWLSLLLCRYPGIGKIYLVVRPKKGGDPEARFWSEIVSSPTFDPLRERQPSLEAFLRERIVVLDADVSRPLCGFAPERLAELRGTIGALVNVAGVVDFNPPLDDALLANAFGVQNLVELARALGDVPVLHTSTAYVAGYRTGAIAECDPRLTPFPKYDELAQVHWDPAREIEECLDLVAQAKHRTDDAFRQSAFLDETRRALESRGEPTAGHTLEEELGRVRRRFMREQLVDAGLERAKYWGWPNIYTYTKSIGEQILAGSGLRYALARPSVIESSLAFPFAGWNEGINTMAPLVYLLMKGHMQVPAGKHTTLDVIPVDMVAGGMVIALAALLEGTQKAVYHLGSSDRNPLPMARLVELCGLYKRRHYQREGRGNPFVNFAVAHLEPVAVTREKFYQHGAPAVAQAARGLSALAARAGIGPARALFKPVARALSSYAALAQRNGEIWELYLPFVAETEYHFSCDNIREDCARVSPEDRARIGWEPEALDWRHYMHNVHIPGLERWVMPQIDEKIARPLRSLRPHDSLLTLLDEMVERHDLSVALSRFDDEGFSRVSYRDLRDRAEAAASRLAAAGVRPGDRVVLAGQNHPDWPIVYFGILAAGATAVPIDPSMEAPALLRVLAASRARAAVWDAPFGERAGREALGHLPALAALDLHAVAAPRADGAPAPAVPRPALSPDAVASVLYTSGTTGEPKGVLLSHRNFTSLLAQLAPVFPLSPGDRALSVLPLHHTFEFTCGLLLPLSRGARVLYLDELSGARLTEAMQKGRVTAMVGVPALWQLLERKISADVKGRGPLASAAFDLALTLNRLLGEKVGVSAGRALFGPVHAALGGHVRYLISGGAALPRDTARLFAGLGLPLAEGYGLTEASPVLTVASASAGGRGGTVGKAIPGVEIKIDAPDDAGVGEVLARGANVMSGYAEDPDATARAIDPDGWLHTGDLGKLDRKGVLTIVGRSKEVVVGANGENVYPDDLERLLGQVEGVCELCVIGAPDPRGGERVAILGVATAGEAGESQAEREARHGRARASLREAILGLPASSRPAVVVVQDAPLPRTATRKARRSEVRSRIEADLARAPVLGVGGLRSPLVRAAVAAAARRAPGSISAQSRLREDLGFDSLMTLELATALEAELGAVSAAETVGRASTVGELEAALGLDEPPSRGTPIGAAFGDPPEEQAEGARAFAVPGVLRDTAKSAIAGLQARFYGNVMRPRVSGRAFIPHNRSTLVVANHASHLDMGLVKYALGAYGRDLLSLAARDYFFDSGPVQRTVFENFTNLVPIDRHSGLRETLREVGRLIEQGKTILVFPEGTRSPDGTIGEFKGAVGHLALRHQIDILPVFLGGTFEAMPKSQPLPTRRALVARIGAPLLAADLARLTRGAKPASAARHVAHLAQRAVEALRDGSVLDLSRLERSEVDAFEAAPRKHPLAALFDELERRFIPGRVTSPVSFYFTLGADAEAKWTVRIGPTACEVTPGKPASGAADCVLKTSPEMFSRIVREGYQPGAPEFASGAIKSNDVMLLETFQKAFQLG